jgi:hypothetical protein
MTVGQPFAAVRVPAYLVVRAPLAAPSANQLVSGKPSPLATHVPADLGVSDAGGLLLILSSGLCSVGLKSTAVGGLQGDGAGRLLRSGGVDKADIEYALADDPATRGSHGSHKKARLRGPRVRFRAEPVRHGVLALRAGRTRRARHACARRACGCRACGRRDHRHIYRYCVHILNRATAHITPSATAHASAAHIFLSARPPCALRRSAGVVTCTCVEEVREARQGLAVMNRARIAAEGAGVGTCGVRSISRCLGDCIEMHRG